MPLPLNQMTKRFSTGAVLVVAGAAYAVPVELNIDTRGGSPRMTGACVAVNPFRKNLRESLLRRVMMFAIGDPFHRFYQPIDFIRAISSSLKWKPDLRKSSSAWAIRD